LCALPAPGYVTPLTGATVSYWNMLELIPALNELNCVLLTWSTACANTKYCVPLTHVGTCDDHAHVPLAAPLYDTTGFHVNEAPHDRPFHHKPSPLRETAMFTAFNPESSGSMLGAFD